MREEVTGKNRKGKKTKEKISLGSAIVFSALSVWQAWGEILPGPVGIIVYILAACSLAAACQNLYQEIRKNVIVRILERAKRNSGVKRFLEDYSFRTILTTILGFGINVFYAVYNGIIGVTTQSAWFITMAVYYGILMVMRYQAVNAQRKIRLMKDDRQIQAKQVFVLKTDGILLLVLNLALSGVIFLTIAQDTAKRYSEIMVITIATYTFYKIIMAVINMVKVRKMNSPILIAIRNIGVAQALVSVLTLQATMLASLQEESTLNANQMNAITGLVVCILIAALGIHMIYLSHRKRKEL